MKYNTNHAKVCLATNGKQATSMAKEHTNAQFSKHNHEPGALFAIYADFESENTDVSYTNKYENQITCSYD